MNNALRFVFTLMVTLFFSGTTVAQKKVALVIGNSAYQFTNALPNPKNDASAISKKLKSTGFKVIKGIDLTKDQMMKKIRKFTVELKGADVGLFFYAGHGMQMDGVNYLIPTDAKLKSEDALDFEVIKSDFITKQLEKGQNRVNLVFLDACRDNPLKDGLARSMGLSTRSLGKSRGFATVQKSNGTMIAYATDPGKVASDGTGKHSPFTKALLKYMDQPGLDISILMRRVRAEVKAETNGVQTPWDVSSLTGDFSFVPPLANGSQVASIQPQVVQLPKTGELTIRSNVNGDQVLINGEDYGSTKLNVELKPGVYNIEVKKRGYNTFEKSYTVVPGADQVLYAKLKMNTPVKPKYVTKSAPKYTAPNVKPEYTPEQRKAIELFNNM
jgi:hypothetical protein